MPTSGRESSELIAPYLPRLVHDWLAVEPDRRWRVIDGTVVFVDVSGFTRLSERLARRGRVGAEELTDVIGSCFSHLLAVAYAEGGSLLKFGGDALLILFSDDHHTERACRAAVGMRAKLREISQIDVPGGRVRLRMSVGVHRGEFLVFLVGDSHRELVVTGPAATQTVTMEGIADAGEIVVSQTTAAHLAPAALGASKGTGRLLRRSPGAPTHAVAEFVPPRPCDLTDAVPVGLRAHLVGGAADAEHRIASIGFVHFDDVDRIAQHEGPAVLAAALDELVADAAAAAADHGVTFLGTDIDKDGGKIILAAGVPLASGQDEERLLRVVRHLATAGHRLPLRIGVNRGHVFAGSVGPSYRRTYTVMGDTVNLAARVMAAAKPGQVLATGAVIEHARSAFRTEALPPFMVKGKSKPVQAFAVGAPLRRQAGAAVARLPLTGRGIELAQLEDALQQARKGQGTVIELRAEPGMGKSRLVSELAFAAADVALVRVACLPYETANPYWALRELIEELLGVTPDDDRDAVVARLRAHVAAHAPELEPWMALVATPLQLDLPESAESASLEGRFRKQRVEELALTLLGTLLPSPAIVVLEDVHWMDDASTDVLRMVERTIVDGPWLVCVTRNDDATGFHVTEATSTVLRLDPLSEADATALVHAATEEQPLRPHEVALLVQRADGNPRFIGEFVSEALAVGSTDSLPDSVDSLVSAQIDRLPRATRTFLRHASVLGNAFDAALLDAVVEVDDGATAGERANAELDRFLVPDGPGRLRFRHALLRDVAYGGLPYRSRTELHRRAGHQLERRLQRPEEQAALLSLHYFHGEQYETAVRYARVAAERAVADYANVEAAELYERALAAARRTGDVDESALADMAEALGDVSDRIGVYDRARDAYRTARRFRSDDPVVGAQLCLKEALMAERLGRASLAVRWIRRGLKLLDGVAPDQQAQTTRARLAVWYAALRAGGGRHREAVRWCETAIELARAAGDRGTLAHALYILDWAYVELGRFDQATHSREALRLYEELGDLSGQAVVSNNLGVLAFLDGRWDESRALYEKARDARLRTGDAVQAALSSSNMAEILIEQCAFEEAESLLVDARRVYRSANYRTGVAATTAWLGRIAARTGNFEDAYRMLDEAKQLYVTVEATNHVLEVDTILAEALVLAGDGTLALAVALAATNEARAEGHLGLFGDALVRWSAYALALLDRFDEAERALDEILVPARGRPVDYEIALALVAQERIAEWAQRPIEPSTDARLTLSRLGIPSVPLPRREAVVSTA